MLEKPVIDESSLLACLQVEYGLPVDQLEFLPLGADLNTAVYRAVSDDQKVFFVKLRKGAFDETSVLLPKFLSDQEISQVIAPFSNRAGRLWVEFGSYKLILYPFIEGKNGYETAMSNRNWSELGCALRRIHLLDLPLELSDRIRKETYPSQWRRAARSFVEGLDSQMLIDKVAVELMDYLKSKKDQILYLVDRSEQLAFTLQADPPEFVLCHSDVHPGNILIGSHGEMFIVDWDDPILAPKERDLMFIGGGFGFIGHTAEEEADLFYNGYGQTQFDLISLAYYRFERIVQDIAVECQQIFLSSDSYEDREQALRYLVSNFEAHGTIDRALKTDLLLRDR